jgi:MFS family permease
VGVYGLTQACLQIPFGLLSDRFGRKPVITAGLLIFAAGSIVAALSDTISGVIIGRALQGSGAVAAAVIALATDLTRESQRSKIMACIGITIGASFSVSLVLGPVLYSTVGGAGIFYVTAILSMLALAALWRLVPMPPVNIARQTTHVERTSFLSVLADTQLLRLDFGIMLLHLMLMAGFIAVPLYLRDVLGLPVTQHWWVYLSITALAILVMMPILMIAEKKGAVKALFLGAVLLLGLAQLGLSQIGHNLFGFAALAILFFAAFNTLEALLPSFVSKLAPANRKGAAFGVYSSSQFLGAFLGGLAGGWMLDKGGYSTIFILGSILAAVWLIIAAGMRQLPRLQTYLLKLADSANSLPGDLAGILVQIRGVKEARIIEEEGIALLQVDHRILDEAALQEYAALR